MLHFLYMSVLAACLLAVAPLPWLLQLRIWRRWRRLSLSVLPAAALFVAWDVHAIESGHWSFDAARVTGVSLGSLPLEELMFFVVVPLCAVMAYESILAGKNAGASPRHSEMANTGESHGADLPTDDSGAAGARPAGGDAASGASDAGEPR